MGQCVAIWFEWRVGWVCEPRPQCSTGGDEAQLQFQAYPYSLHPYSLHPPPTQPAHLVDHTLRGLVDVGAAARRQRVHLIKEQHAGCGGAGARKQLAHRPLALADVPAGKQGRRARREGRVGGCMCIMAQPRMVRWLVVGQQLAQKGEAAAGWPWHCRAAKPAAQGCKPALPCHSQRTC